MLTYCKTHILMLIFNFSLLFVALVNKAVLLSAIYYFFLIFVNKSLTLLSFSIL